MKLRTLSTLTVAPLALLATSIVLDAGPAAASPGTKVTTTETQFHIALSQKKFTPGTYTFVAKNMGTVTHALMITGPGIKSAMTSDIAPGKSANLTVTFKDGRYDIFCPIPGHKMLGMNVNVTVGATSTGASTTKTTSAPKSGGYGY